MSESLLDLVRELNALNDDNLAERVIKDSDVQWCLSELQDILEAKTPTLTPPPAGGRGGHPMTRSTHKDERGYYLTGDGIYIDDGDPAKARGADVDRLAAYEDSGVEPEDVAKCIATADLLSTLRAENEKFRAELERKNEAVDFARTTDAEAVRLAADLARVTAERDAAISDLTYIARTYPVELCDDLVCQYCKHYPNVNTGCPGWTYNDCFEWCGKKEN